MKFSIALLCVVLYSVTFSLEAIAKECSRTFRGAVSFYADRFHGRRTASGARLDNNAYTCAHRTLPFGTKILVENPRNGSKCIVTVTDRGPFHRNRVIDLTRAAARKLGISGIGTVVCSTGKLIESRTKEIAKSVLPEKPGQSRMHTGPLISAGPPVQVTQ